MSSNLSVRLREETAEAHRHAERAEFVGQLFKGTLSRASWSAFLRNLYALYGSLEVSLEAHRAHPALAPAYLPELFRCAALRRDLAFYSGDAESDAGPTPAGSAYAAHLRTLSETQPARLVAHAYTRYLGDLSGGQAMRRAVARAFALDEGGAGVAFFDFPLVADHAAYKNQYRAMLDALPLEPAEADAVVDEARAAFSWSARIMDDALRADAP